MPDTTPSVNTWFNRGKQAGAFLKNTPIRATLATGLRSYIPGAILGQAAYDYAQYRGNQMANDPAVANRMQNMRDLMARGYTPTDKDDRWTYAEGSTAGGLVIYEDGRLAYSNHSTDPASDFHSHNAFDLVRIHKFGELDEGVSNKVTAGNMPSFKALSNLLKDDEETKLVLGQEAIAEATKMINVYKEFAETCLAIPVFTGRKTEKEKFAIAVNTLTEFISIILSFTVVKHRKTRW